MKAITLWDPWAALMWWEFKKIETRHWATKYRGPLAIHAALKKPSFLGASAAADKFQRELKSCLDERQAAARGITMFPGHVLCIVKLVAIEPTASVVGDLTERERLFGNYDPDRYAWFTEMLEPFDTPVPATGHQQLWNWSGQ